MSSETDVSQFEQTNVQEIYDIRRQSPQCCPRKCFNGSGITFEAFKMWRNEIRSIRQQSSEMLQTAVGAMMTMDGRVHTRSTRLTCRVFNHNTPVCYEAFSFCYNIPERTHKRWRVDIRQRKQFLCRSHGLRGCDGIRANRAINQVKRSQVVQCITEIASLVGEQLPNRPDDLIF